ncbi:LytTR family DNA-binding domain-containing protein [Psychroserpens sp. AS72]|uniref:LytR/AlgR family response regulator transcription factor n=1 Tax=Psychroserpens sp. AS72 TaxID=3135775 RepID=UPI00316E564D
MIGFIGLSQSQEKKNTLDSIYPNISKLFHDYHNENEILELDFLISIYSSSSNDSIGNFWKSYYSIIKYLEYYNQDFYLDTKIKEINFELLHKYANYNLLKSKAHQLEGFYYDHFFNNKEKTEYHYNKAIYFLAVDKTSTVNDWFKLGIFFKNIEKYKKAISLFHDEQFQYFSYNSNIYKFKSYEGLYLCYKDLKVPDSALYYLEKMQSTKNTLNERELNEIVDNSKKSYKKIKSVIENKNIKNRNKALKNSFSELQNRLHIALPILGGTIFILIFIFYLYKRYKKKSTVLEEEQSETLQKLDELKNIVIKNHIILKDKTKVYISDLMYIKSDDHYLEIVTENDKKHTVRGKLSQIKEELPPNFIQCHRSYIVNSNFIKQINSTTLTLINKEQIPLSRSYKKKF